MAHRTGLLTTVLRRLTDLFVPTIGVGSGAALGAGAALLLSCDEVVATRDLVLGLPEIQDGVIPAVVLGAIVDRVPSRRGFELATTGRRMGPQKLTDSA